MHSFSYGSQLLLTVRFKEHAKNEFWFCLAHAKQKKINKNSHTLISLVVRYPLFLPFFILFFYWKIYSTESCIAQKTLGIMSVQALALGNPNRNRWTFQYSSLPLFFFSHRVPWQFHWFPVFKSHYCFSRLYEAHLYW